MIELTLKWYRKKNSTQKLYLLCVAYPSNETEQMKISKSVCNALQNYGLAVPIKCKMTSK